MSIGWSLTFEMSVVSYNYTKILNSNAVNSAIVEQFNQAVIW